MAKDKDILEKALAEFKEAEDFEGEQRKLRRDDLKFFLGDSDNNWQWPEEIVKLRKQPGRAARPIITVNKAPLHIRQITNEERQNRPAIKVRPVDDKGDPEVAEIFDGIIRHIQDVSDADTAYDTACEHQTVSGLGYWRILTDYVSEDSFDQDIKIARVRNPFKVYLDPYIQTPEGADAEFGFVFEDIPIERFKRDYPKAKPKSWDAMENGWVTKDTVRIAEYFCAKYVERELVLLEDGTTGWADEGAVGEKSRKVMDRQVKWYKMTAFEILDSRDWPSKYIGIVRVVGEEWEVDDKLIVKGAMRNAKDSLRMYNFWTSAEAEMVALQPKAPFVGAAGAFEGYKTAWENANTQNIPYLEYNPVDVNGTPVPPPQRQMPPAPAVGFIQAKMGAADDIKATFGQFDASLGQKSNETSGKAILARQREGDTATYHYLDNLSKSIRHTGRVLVDMIPRIYDTQRVARIIGEDGKPDLVGLNPEQEQPVMQGQNGRIKKIYNLGAGRYDVSVSVGPSFTTKRQEAAEFMTQIAQSVPTVIQQAGDIIMEQFDMPGADRLAKRLKAFLPPNIIEQEDDDDAESKLVQLQGASQQMEQALQNADAMMDQVQEEMKKLAEENQLLKVKNADKQNTDLQQIKAAQSELESDMTRLQAAEKVFKATVSAEQARFDAALAKFHAEVKSTDADNRIYDSARQMQMDETEKAQQQEKTQQAGNELNQVIAEMHQNTMLAIQELGKIVSAPRTKRMIGPSGNEYVSTETVDG